MSIKKTSKDTIDQLLYIPSPYVLFHGLFGHTLFVKIVYRIQFTIPFVYIPNIYTNAKYIFNVYAINRKQSYCSFGAVEIYAGNRIQ